ncbi:SRPBCC family protein [Nonomuraea sp. NPDC001636]|uniref:SRPBCC family protein n=1 Tax=Nonomuraea sp. NPDC001636 TaxID=3154391 RepID=UPI00331EB969
MEPLHPAGLRPGRGGKHPDLAHAPAERQTMTFRPKVLQAEPGRVLRWLGHLLVPGIFDGAHEFALTPTAMGTRLVQSETFKGVLVPFVGKTIAGTERDFVRLNEALKKHLES